MFRYSRAFRLRQQYPIARHIIRRTAQPQRRWQSQIMYNGHGEQVRFQAVRFKRPDLFTARRLATLGLYSVTFYLAGKYIWSFLDIEVEVLEDDETEDKKREGQEVTDEEEEGPFYAEEDSTFIPMTWAQKLPRTFYKGSDPEWQEFVKVAKDKDRHKKIQNELVQIVYTGTVQHPAISRQLGKDAKVGKYWLDISFPDGPPQEYQRSGIEIGDDFIAWSQQKVSPENQWRLTRALWPRAAFDSLWATTKVLAGINFRRMKEMVGWESSGDGMTPEARYRHAIEMMAKHQQAQERKAVGKTQTDPEGSPGAVVGASSASSPAQAPNADAKRLPWQINVPMPSSSGSNSTDLPIAMHVFQATLSKSWNPKKAEPPRGTFVVQGLVEVRGARGRMLFDVQSCYDPKASKYVAVNAAVRNFKKWNQAPRGGA